MIDDIIVGAARELQILKRERDLEIERTRFRFERASAALYARTRDSVDEHYGRVRRGLEAMEDMLYEDVTEALLEDADFQATLYHLSSSAGDGSADDDLNRRLQALLPPESRTAHRPVSPPPRSARSGLPVGETTASALLEAIREQFEPGAEFDSRRAREAFLARYPQARRPGLSSRLGGALRALVDKERVGLVEATGDLRRPNRYRMPPVGGEGEGEG